MFLYKITNDLYLSLSTFPSGGLLFGNNTGTPATDTTNLFWDNASKQLLIGNTTYYEATGLTGTTTGLGNGSSLTLNCGSGTTGSGGLLNLFAGNSSSGDGGFVSIQAGSGLTLGGGFDVQGGDSLGVFGDGGAMSFTAGDSTGGGFAGAVYFGAGAGDDGGAIDFYAGSGLVGTAGSINFYGGTGSGTANGGSITVQPGTGVVNGTTSFFAASGNALISIGPAANTLGFYNATAIARPTTAGAAAAFVAGAGTAVNDASTFDGYTLRQVVRALRNLGLLT
jgi:hypothetical protein